MKKHYYAHLVIAMLAPLLVQSCSKSLVIDSEITEKPRVLIAPGMFLHKNSAPGLQGHFDEMDILTANGMNLFGWSIENWGELAPSPSIRRSSKHSAFFTKERLSGFTQK